MTTDPVPLRRPNVPEGLGGKKIRLNSGTLVSLTVVSENGSSYVRADECFDPHATHPPTIGRTVGYLEEADLLYTYRAQIVI